MLFLAVYKFHNPSEELDKRTLKLPTNWQPPFEFKGHWARGDGQRVARLDLLTVVAYAPEARR